MGQLGLAIGPFLAGNLLQIVTDSNLGSLFSSDTSASDFLYVNHVSSVVIVLLIVPFMLPVVYFMASTIPSIKEHHKLNPLKPKSESGNGLRDLNLPMKAFLLLLVVVSLRSLATPGSVGFIPRLFEEKGWTPSEYGAITSIFWIASALAGVYFGGLADRFDRRFVLMGSLIAAAPAFFLLPIIDDTFAYGLAIMAGGLSGGSHSVIVVLAQEILPSGKGFATGAILGSIFGMGALGTLLIGAIADGIGLGSAFQLVAVTVTIAGILALLLPKNRRKTIPVVTPK